MVAAADPPSARSASRATRRCARRSTLLGAGAAAGAHRRDLDRDGNDEDDARDHADGRLVAAPGQGRVRARARRRRLRAAQRDAAAGERHGRRRPGRARLRRRLVGLRVQGPARRVRPQAHRGRVVARLLRRRRPGEVPRARCRRRCADALDTSTRKAALRPAATAPTDPQPACFDQNRLDDRQRRSTCRRSRSRTGRRSSRRSLSAARWLSALVIALYVAIAGRPRSALFAVVVRLAG